MFKETNNITQSENVNNIVYDGIGFNGIRYIQESGQKEKGKIYLDKNQPGLWYCLNTNSSINNTSDFTRADSTALLDKLQNLTDYKFTNLFPGCRIWRLGNLCGVQVTNANFDDSWAKGTTSNSFTYHRTLDFPSWFSIPVGTEIGVSVCSSDAALSGELMVRKNGEFQFYMVNIFNKTVRPADGISVSGCSSWVA